MNKLIADSISMERFVSIFENAYKSNTRFCFILGAGASKESGIRTGTEMAREWSEGMSGRMQPGEITAEMKKWGLRNLDPTSENYFGLYAMYFHGNSAEGYAYLAGEMENKEPSFGYAVLANILADDSRGHNVVITTNFDTLVEDALLIYTKKHPLLVEHEALTEYINLNVKRPIIAKIHRGLYFKPFNDARETNGLKEGWEQPLRNIFSIYTPIVIGYAGGDKSLMEFLKKSEVNLKTIYWCYYKDDVPSLEIQQLVKDKKGYLIQTGGFDYMMYRLSVIANNMDDPDPCDFIRTTADGRISNYTKKKAEFEAAIPRTILSGKKSGGFWSRQSILNVLKAENELNLARQLIMNGKYNEALMHCMKAMNYGARNAIAYNRRGCAYHGLMKFAEALADFDKAIELNPGFAIAYSNRGSAYANLGNSKEALVDYSKAEELYPSYAPTYFDRGNLYRNLKEYQRALEDYNKAIEWNAAYRDAYINRGQLYIEIKRYDDALKDFRKVIELEPSCSIAYNNIGVVYSEMKRYEEAIVYYSKAIELAPDYVISYCNRGYDYSQLERYQEALADYEMALRLDPDNAMAKAGVRDHCNHITKPD